MLDINNSQSKYFLRNSHAIPFFYKKFYLLIRPLRNLIHFATIGRLATGLLHDLTNPLTSILLSINFIDSNTDIKKNSQELSELIRIIQNQIKNSSEKETFKISNLIQDCFILMKYKALSNNVRLINIIHKDFEIYGNKITLMRVINNLISNAIESYENIQRDKNDVIISVFEENKYICISIEDFGCGISEKESKRLFKKFYTNKNNGTGIGLYISYKNMRIKYNGKIEVESQKNLGSIFKIKIPLKITV
ncbi:MAG: hypothetical protein RLY43_846 [Bacteroidota bacterium]|jgi:polar amino acid transport system substrate-binding protein